MEDGTHTYVLYVPMETSTKLRFVCHGGFDINTDEINTDIAYLPAISSDDRLVHIYAHIRIRIGASGTGEGSDSSEVWEFKAVKQYKKGVYSFLKGLPNLITQEKERRIGNGLAFKQWEKRAKGVIRCLSWDEELLLECVERGNPYLLAIIKNYRI